MATLEELRARRDNLQQLGTMRQRKSELEAKASGVSQTPQRSWTQVPGEALQNIPGSAMQFGSDIATAVFNPLDTMGGLYNVVKGGVQKLVPGQSDRWFKNTEEEAEAVGKFFADRYGGEDEVKNTIATDPVGFLADASVVLLGGGVAASKVPAFAKAAEKAKTAGRAVDPIRAVAAPTGKMISNILGFTTGAGADALRIAAQTGKEAGPVPLRVIEKADDGDWMTSKAGEVASPRSRGAAKSRMFLQSMRQEIPMETVVGEAKKALAAMRAKNLAEFKTGKAQAMGAAPGEPLNFGSVLSQVGKVMDKYGSPLQKEAPSAIPKKLGKVRKEISTLLAEWQAGDPARFHTVQGLDELRQAVGNHMNSLKYGTPERKMAGEIYYAIRKSIDLQSPGYAKAMGDYHKARQALDDVEKELSLGKAAGSATALRKLQAILRKDASSAFGKRAQMAARLEGEGGGELLMPGLAGQAVSSALPRGITARFAGTGAAGASGIGAIGGSVSPMGLAGLMAFSPRLVGEAAHYAGRTFGGMTPEQVMAAFQAGRIENAQQGQ